jgi:hypothetical protein
VYKIESGEVFAYDPEEGQFLPLLAGVAPGAPRPEPGPLVDLI